MLGPKRILRVVRAGYIKSDEHGARAYRLKFPCIMTFKQFF